MYNGEFFEDEKVVYGSVNVHLSPDVYYSDENKGGVSKYSFIENGKEYLFEVEAEDSFKIAKYDFNHSILMLPQSDDRKLFFYTKTGERLWVYEEEEENKEISMSIPVVDDIVVIISGPRKVQGFRIRTGEKLWETRDFCPEYLFEGEDKALYGCMSNFCKDLFLYRLDPVTGKLCRILRVAPTF